MRNRSDRPGTVDSEEALRLLAQPVRRRLLIELADDETDVISPHSVGFDGDTGGDADRTDADHVTVQLYHNHLPRLANVGVVDWDREDGTVTAGPAFDEVEPFVEVLDRHRHELPDDWR